MGHLVRSLRLSLGQEGAEEYGVENPACVTFRAVFVPEVVAHVTSMQPLGFAYLIHGGLRAASSNVASYNAYAALRHHIPPMQAAMEKYY